MTTSPGAAGPSGGWTDDAVAILTKLWREGDLSAAMIARQLGVTRNAVLGKIHRLGLSKPRTPRARAIAPPPRTVRRRRASTFPPAPRPAKVPPPPKPVAEIGLGLVSRLEQLSPRTCHWPLGDPQAADFAFCGRRADAGPYCPAHSAVAYRGRGVDVAELARLLRT